MSKIKIGSSIEINPLKQFLKIYKLTTNSVHTYVSEGAISIFLRYESKMSDIDKWMELAKECKYLPENDLKVNNI